MTENPIPLKPESFGPVEDWQFDPRNGQPLNRGLHQWKRLFRKPSISDWIILGIILMVLVGSYFYYKDTKTCRETLENLPSICIQYQLGQAEQAELNRRVDDRWNNFTINSFDIQGLNLTK